MNYVVFTRSWIRDLLLLCLGVFIFSSYVNESNGKESEYELKRQSSSIAGFGNQEAAMEFLGSETVGMRQGIEDFQNAAHDEYILSEGDILFVDVFNHEELSGQFTIGPDGKKTLPVAGLLHLAGLTREEAAERITEALAPQFQTQMTVTVRVDSFVGNRFYMYGGITNPGVFQFDFRPTLLDLITAAGGVPIPQVKPSGEQAPKPFTVYSTIIRGDNRLSMVDITRLVTHHDLSLNLRLQQGDIVHIHRLETAPLYIMGEVQSPGYYNVSPNMTLLDAITQAGTFTQDAAKNRIHVVHMRNYTHEIISFKELADPDVTLDIELQPGDLVYVPTNWLAKFNYLWSQLLPIRSLPFL